MKSEFFELFKILLGFSRTWQPPAVVLWNTQHPLESRSSPCARRLSDAWTICRGNFWRHVGMMPKIIWDSKPCRKLYHDTFVEFLKHLLTNWNIHSCWGQASTPFGASVSAFLGNFWSSGVVTVDQGTIHRCNSERYTKNCNVESFLVPRGHNVS